MSIPLAVTAVIAALAIGVSLFVGIPIWWALLAMAGTMFFNGLLATIEDDLPGGFNNPDGSDTPRYVRLVRRAFWALAGLLGLFIVAIFILRFYG